MDRISSVDSTDVAVINYIHGIGLISSKHMNCDCGSCGEVETSVETSVENIYVFLSNAHGDVVQVIHGDKVISRYDYDAYGVAKHVDSADEKDENPYRYSGEYTDLESGLIYLRARFYNPEIGRFLNQDPIRDGQNWHAYAGGNPVMNVDPSGLAWYNDAWNGVKKGAKAVASFGSGAIAGFSEAVSYGLVTKDATIENPTSFQFGKIAGNFAASIVGILITGIGAGGTIVGGGVSGGALVPVGVGVTAWGLSITGSGVVTAAGNIRDFYQASNSDELGSGSGDGSDDTEVASPKDTWGNKNTLEDHFKRHGEEVGANSSEEYVEKAHDFYNNREEFQSKVDDDGVTRVYDAETNTFGSYNADGSTKTYFKPIDKQAYFDRQPGN